MLYSRTSQWRVTLEAAQRGNVIKVPQMTLWWETWREELFSKIVYSLIIHVFWAHEEDQRSYVVSIKLAAHFFIVFMVRESASYLSEYLSFFF